jgi:Phosphatidate phosphatase APP1, catalytic domain
MAAYFSGDLLTRKLTAKLRWRSSTTKLVVDAPPLVGTCPTLRVRFRLLVAQMGQLPLSSIPAASLAMEPAAGIELKLTPLDASETPVNSKPINTTTNWAGFIDIELLVTEEVRTIRVEAQASIVGELIPVTIIRADAKVSLVISDVDKTFLASKIRDIKDFTNLMFRDGLRREFLPGMTGLAKTWMARAEPEPDADAEARRMWIFLSGSPFFFNRNLLAAMGRTGVHTDGIYLRGIDHLKMRPIWRPDFVLEMMRALTAHSGYKIASVLRILATLPVDTSLTMLGDDSETDYFVYASVSHLLSGHWSLDNLCEQLAVREPGPWEPEIRNTAQEILDRPGVKPRLTLIGIRRTGNLTPKVDSDLDIMPMDQTIIHKSTDELAARMLG